MGERVRIGVIGTSSYCEFMHIQPLKSHPNAALSAICGRNQDRAREVARKYDIPHVYADYRRMIEEAKIDALVIVSPDDQHYPMVMAGLAAGLHIVCEKPLAMTAVQAQEMLEKAESTGAKHMVYFTYRWTPFYRYVKTLMDDGFIGRTYHVGFRFFGGWARGANYMWRFDGERSNGVLGDLGSHLVDLARWLVGDVARVCGHLGTFVDRNGDGNNPLLPANDVAHLAVEFENGALGSLEVSAIANIGSRICEQHAILHGESGALEVNFSFDRGWEIFGLRHGEEHFQKLVVPNEPIDQSSAQKPFTEWELQMNTSKSVGDRYFVDTLLGKGSILPTFLNGYNAQKVIDAANKSHKTGKMVS